MPRKCLGKCDQLPHFRQSRYSTGIRYCVVCYVSFLSKAERCPCCGYFLRRKARKSCCRDTVPPMSKWVDIPDRIKPEIAGTAERKRGREAWRRYYYRYHAEIRRKKLEYYQLNKVEICRKKRERLARQK